MPKVEIKKEQIFNAINKIFESSKDKIPNKELYLTLKNELNILKRYTCLTTEENYVFAIIFYSNLMGESIDMLDMSKYFNTKTYDLLPIFDLIQVLVEKKIVISKKHRARNENLLFNSNYTISKNIGHCILTNKPFPKVEIKKTTSDLEVIQDFSSIISLLIDNEMYHIDLIDIYEAKVNEFSSFKIIKLIKEYNLTMEETLIFFYVVWKTLSGQNGIDLEPATASIFQAQNKQVKFNQSLVQGSNPLVKNELIEYVSTGFMNNFEANPTKQSADILAKCDIILKMPTSRRSSIILPTTITEKNLYYSEKEKQQMEAVRSILHEENYTQLVDRMTSKGMPKGVNVLLFGAPGTGKTESVLQLAKQSGREIVKVDISNTKSMWFGESEKIIKRIFNDYREYAKRCSIAPILFFNEADAVLSKRSSNGANNTQQTENAIQNILLDELENFEGIFMATTNLMNNLDKAFERRLLYKVEFMVPTSYQRAFIWQSKFSTLSFDACENLAYNYELSGGQIDNIYRKSEINYILTNEEVTLSLLMQFCEEEVNHSRSYTQIGFGKAG